MNQKDSSHVEEPFFIQNYNWFKFVRFLIKDKFVIIIFANKITNHKFL